jgi:membrane fusion protein, multidrug efflux system
MLRGLSILKVVLLLSSFGFLLFSCGSSEEKAPAGVPGANTLPVDVDIVREEALDEKEVIVGTMVPFQQVAIVSEIPQKVVRISFRDGDYVRKGQLLYKLNDADIIARLHQLGAELKLAELNEGRLNKLLKTETVKQQEYDEAAMKLQSLEAQRESLRVELKKTEIKAPFSGKIGISKVFPGSYVSPGLELVSLQNQSMIKIDFSVPERYITLVKTGKKITFTTELSAQQYTASIKATEPEIDDQDRSLKVQAITENSGAKFRAGLSAKIYFSTIGKDAKGITLPTEALIPGAEGYSVFIIKNGTAKSTPVSVGNRTETRAIITAGLYNGDSVIVSNILRTGDGMPVHAVASVNTLKQ